MRDAGLAATCVGTVLLLVAAACAGPPERRCATRDGESGLEVDCPPPEGGQWADDAVREAEEGFEERAPGSLP